MKVVPLTPDEDARAAAVLAQAFRADPIFTWLSDRPGFTPFVFGSGVPVFREQGIALATLG